jgi:succinate dehydrogenase / fumarate reductase cytochrome b subunit
MSMAEASRPLSPHLQVYRWYLTMALSIAHRVTGAGLAVGLLLLTWWLLALASGPDSFATVRAVMDNWFGGLVLFGFTLFLWFHTLNGVRHLVWDTGYGLDKDVARQSGIVVVGGAVILTLLTWIAILIAG